MYGPVLFVQASLPNGSKRLRPLQEIRWNTSKLASNNPHRLRRARITRASGGWISSFNERTLATKCKVDFEIFFKIHPMVFGDRWNIIKQPDGWEPTMNWTIDVKFCLSWNWRQSTLSATLIGHLRWHHGQHSQMCLHTSEGRTKVKLSHWHCWNTPSLSIYIHLIYLPLWILFYFPDQIPICVEIAHAFFDSGHLLLFFLETSLGSDLWETMPTLSSSGRSINHRRLLNAKNHMAYIYIHYIPIWSIWDVKFVRNKHWNTLGPFVSKQSF